MQGIKNENDGKKAYMAFSETGFGETGRHLIIIFSFIIEVVICNFHIHHNGTLLSVL